MSNDSKRHSYNSPSIESDTIELLSAKLLVATEELSKANRELKQIQKEREEMLSNISHDLRAPITAIRSALDYINSRDEITLEECKNTLALIDRRTGTLEDLIQDMYYLFCVEDTSKELQITEIDAAPFLEEYFYDTLADSRFTTHELNLNINPDLNCRIKVDIQKIVRVLDNLFTNAAKYTPEDSCIDLEASVKSVGENSILEIVVADNGPGIAKEALPKIFNRTYTVSSARTPGVTASGSGLGLAIVKAIMERHGGDVTCTSELGKGCRFILSLPAFI